MNCTCDSAHTCADDVVSALSVITEDPLTDQTTSGASVPAEESPAPKVSPETIQEIIRKATEGRRRPLRGKALVDLARKLGLDWADTGTGHTPGTVFLSGDKVTRYLV